MRADTTLEIVDLGMCVGVQYYPWPADFSDEAETMGVSKRIPHTAIPLIVRGRTRVAFAHPRAIVTVAKNTLFDLALSLVNDYVDGNPELDPDPEIKAELISRWLTTSDADPDDWKLAYVLEHLVGWDDEPGEPPIAFSQLGLPRLLRYADERGDLEAYAEKYGIRFSTSCPLSSGEKIDCDECPHHEIMENKQCAKPGLGWFGFCYATDCEFEIRDGPEEIPDNLKGFGLTPVKSVYEEEEAS